MAVCSGIWCFTVRPYPPPKKTLKPPKRNAKSTIKARTYIWPESRVFKCHPPPNVKAPFPHSVLQTGLRCLVVRSVHLPRSVRLPRIHCSRPSRRHRLPTTGCRPVSMRSTSSGSRPRSTRIPSMPAWTCMWVTCFDVRYVWL